jgi:hypothetical protein
MSPFTFSEIRALLADTSNIANTADQSTRSTSNLFHSDVAPLKGLQVQGDIMPGGSNPQTIGSSNNHFKTAWIDELHLSTNTLYIGDTPVLGTDADTVLIKADPDQSINILTRGTGETSLTSYAGVNMTVSGLNAPVVVQATGIGGRVTFGANTAIDFTAPLSTFNGDAA